MSIVTPRLPPELWKHIFRYATYPERPNLCEFSYIPFQPAFDERNASLSVKRALALVCTQWRALVMEYSYEDVKIRHGAYGLLEALERSEQESERGYGQRVRRVELPSKDLPGHRHSDVQLTNVLKWCPRVEVLVKPPYPHEELIDFWSGFFRVPHWPEPDHPLLHLKRLDWSSRSWSANQKTLKSVILRAPNLKYLSLSIRRGLLFPHDDLDLTLHPVLFPSLEILRADRISHVNQIRIRTRDMPRLTHLILDPLLNSSLIRKIGGQAQVVELTNSIKGQYSTHGIADVLHACPNLRELNYDFRGASFFPEHGVHRFLKCVRILLDSSHEVARREDANIQADFWELLEDHFMTFAGPSFPALERVVIYGDCHSIINDIRFHPLRQGLRDRGCVLEVKVIESDIG